MSTSTPSRIVIPRLSPEERKGLQDYWDVYEAHREEVSAGLIQMVSDHPEFKFILQNASLQQSTEQREAGIQRQRRAIYQNEWEPYLENLWEQGKQYAQAGLSFHAWFEIVSAFRKFVRPHLLTAFGKTPKRLLAAMEGADILIEIAMGVIGESYLDAKQELIHEQEKKIQNAMERERADEKFRGLLESAPYAMVVINNKGEIMLVNSQLEKTFGYSGGEIIGQFVE